MLIFLGSAETELFYDFFQQSYINIDLATSRGQHAVANYFRFYIGYL